MSSAGMNNNNEPVHLFSDPQAVSTSPAVSSLYTTHSRYVSLLDLQVYNDVTAMECFIYCSKHELCNSYHVTHYKQCDLGYIVTECVQTLVKLTEIGTKFYIIQH